MRVYKFFLTLIIITTFSVVAFGQISKSIFHEAEVLQVLQVNSYTYLRVKENNNEKWLAAPSVQVVKGEIIFYEGGTEMLNFKSSELNRTFETVLFLESISKNSAGTEKIPFQHESSDFNTVKYTNQKTEKLDLSLESVDGGITIAELIQNKTMYENKTVKIKGRITKYVPQVMRKNWVHLQDGTEYNGKFDLTATTSEKVKVGDIIVVEGKVTLNRDFGYGYFYSLLLENAKLLK